MEPLKHISPDAAPTPRTDALIDNGPLASSLAWIELARQLERESVIYFAEINRLETRVRGLELYVASVKQGATE